MTVLLVSSNSSGSGGGELYLVYLALGLKECGHTVVVLTSRAAYMDSVCSALMTAGIRVVRESLLGLAARPLRVIGALSDWGQISRLRRVYRGIGPDIVHVNQQYDEDGLDYILAAKLSGLPIVGTIHLPMCSNKHLRVLGRIRTIVMRRWYAACRYRRIFVSTAALNEFVDLYGGAELGKAIANGVRLRGASAGEVAGLPQGWTRGDPVVGFFGRLDPQKDPLLLANAWLATREQLPNCRLVFVGEGPLRGDLETWARRVGAEDSVHITGWLSDPSSWWALVDVFAMTSVFEGMSLALLEAIHHGKRIVVTEYDGVKQVAAKVPWMRVVVDRRPSAVASRFEAVMAEGPPNEAVTRRAREYFSTSRMAEETLDVYVKAREDGEIVGVFWWTWSHYHLARFRALKERNEEDRRFVGIELFDGVERYGNPFREQTRDGLGVETLVPDRSWAEVSGIRVAAALWSALTRLNVRVVLVPGYYTIPTIVAACWATLKRRKAVLLTESTSEDYYRNGLLEYVKGLVLRCAFDGVVVGGQRTARYMKDLGFKERRLGRFYDVVDNEYFRAGTEELRHSGTASGWGLPERYFLFVGRLAIEKNLAALVRAFAEYRQAGGRWSLLIAGSGPLLRALESETAMRGVSSEVELRGFQTTAALLPFYAFAGALVLPSRREPWGLVVNEAMASGLPVIVSRRCGCADDLVEPGRNGLLFDPDETHELAECLKRVATMPDWERREFGRRSLEIIEQYTPENFAAEVSRVLG